MLPKNQYLTFYITGQEPTPHNTVAFYAYMSHDLAAPSAGHVLVFDVIKTNVGSAYNHHLCLLLDCDFLVSFLCIFGTNGQF